MTNQRAQTYLNQWPIGTYILNDMHLTIERVVGHLIGGWLQPGGSYSDPEVNPWVALVVEPVVPQKLSHSRPPKDRKHDEERLVAGQLPKKYAIHVVSGGGPYAIQRVQSARIGRFNYATIYEWYPRPTIVRLSDPGNSEPFAYEPGGDVVIAGMWAIGVDGEPNFPLHLPKWTKKSHLPELCAWLDRHVEETNEQA